MTYGIRYASGNLDQKYKPEIHQLYIDQISIEQVALNLETTEAAVRGLRQRAHQNSRSND